MKTVLTKEQAVAVVSELDSYLAQAPCDHSLRLAAQWAKDSGIDLDDLIDLLEEHGCFCDCEVVLNLPTEGDICLADSVAGPDALNPWKLPPTMAAEATAKLYSKVLVSDPDGLTGCHAPAGDWLVPAPFGAKPRKRVRKSMHFFVGLQSGLPCQLGFVQGMDPTTPAAFAKFVRDSGQPGFGSFSAGEADFLLSRIERLKENTPVATHFMEVQNESGRRSELRVHKVFLRKN